MAVAKQYQSDVDAILAKRYDNGGDYWAAARVQCHLGYAADNRLRRTFNHLLEIQHSDGGWRCKKFSFGRGPETEFRWITPQCDKKTQTNKGVEYYGL